MGAFPSGQFNAREAGGGTSGARLRPCGAEVRSGRFGGTASRLASVALQAA
jgi:hypothetical protein